MPGISFLIFIGFVLMVYPIYRFGSFLWERFMLTPEQRWQRRYDRRMKNFFKGI